MTDDPFRRSQGERDGEYAGEGDKGDLFGLRQRPRHLRILVDRESLSEPSTDEEKEAARVLDALTRRQDPVDVLAIDMSRINDPDDDCTPNVVHLRDFTEQKVGRPIPDRATGTKSISIAAQQDSSMATSLHSHKSCRI
jgi:hypothetical protein